MIKEKKGGIAVAALLNDGAGGTNEEEVESVGGAKPEPEPEPESDAPVGDAVFGLPALKPNASAVTELLTPPLPLLPPPVPPTTPVVLSAPWL